MRSCGVQARAVAPLAYTSQPCLSKCGHCAPSCTTCTAFKRHPDACASPPAYVHGNMPCAPVHVPSCTATSARTNSAPARMRCTATTICVLSRQPAHPCARHAPPQPPCAQHACSHQRARTAAMCQHAQTACPTRVPPAPQPARASVLPPTGSRPCASCARMRSSAVTMCAQ